MFHEGSSGFLSNPDLSTGTRHDAMTKTIPNTWSSLVGTLVTCSYASASRFYAQGRRGAAAEAYNMRFEDDERKGEESHGKFTMSLPA
jgi:hypothetical protein